MAGQGGRSRRASCTGADWLTGRPPHGGWAREICCDELWILLYVRTVTVTFSFGIGLRYPERRGSPDPDVRGDQSGHSAARQFGQASEARTA